MLRRSPTFDGFRAIFHQPALGLAEIAWRWSFAAAAGLLLTFSMLEYLDTLPVTSTDLLLLRTRQPVLIARALDHIFRASALRVVLATIVLAVALALIWLAIASLGRAVTLRALLEYFREDDAYREMRRGNDSRPRALIGLNLFRVATTMAATLGFFGAILIARSATADGHNASGDAVLIVFAITTMVGLAWLILNWVLSLAAVFAVEDGQDTLAAITCAVELCRTRLGPVVAASTWFGLAHLVVLFIAASAVAFPLGFAGLLPLGAVLGGVLLVMFLYFAAVDFLYVGRLAAYVAVINLPDLPAPHRQAPASIDPDELILSDLPNP